MDSKATRMNKPIGSCTSNHQEPPTPRVRTGCASSRRLSEPGERARNAAPEEIWIIRPVYSNKVNLNRRLAFVERIPNLRAFAAHGKRGDFLVSGRGAHYSARSSFSRAGTGIPSRFEQTPAPPKRARAKVGSRDLHSKQFRAPRMRLESTAPASNRISIGKLV